MEDQVLIDVMRDICMGPSKYKQVGNAIGKILITKCVGHNEPPVSDATLGIFAASMLGLLQADEIDAIDPSTVIITPGKVVFTYISEPNNVPVVVTISGEEE